MWWRHRKRNAASIAEADMAIGRAERRKEQAAEDRAAATAKLAAESRWFRRILAGGDSDRIAAAIEQSLKER